jgi:hypothetical protein
MTVADLLPSLPLIYADAKQYGLVFGADLAARLAEVQAANPSQHYASPVLLNDGRYLLCGDLLSEVGPGGLYAQGFAALNPTRFDEIEVIPWADAVAMIPQLPVPEA